MTSSSRSPTVAIVTSRMRRLVAPEEAWLLGLRGVLRKIAEEGSRLITAKGTAGFAFVLRGSSRLGIAAHEITIPEDDHRDDDVPVWDRAVIEAADVVYVLQLRANGNIHRLLRERIEQRRDGIILVDIPGLQTDALRQELCLQSVEVWQPSEFQCRPLDGFDVSGIEGKLESQPIRGNVYTIVPFPSVEEWDFLVHTTRACPGPWPDESFDQYADSLLEFSREADHSTLNTLRRIVTRKRLIASNRTIRGGHRVVSLTACPLLHLPSLHRFRRHRVRWDFEPYGLCVRREWLRKCGVQPVRYGDEMMWQSLSEADRPFFQLATGESGIDWTVEQEWRSVGDLDLSEISGEDVILFVPDFESAKSLAQVTDWPVTLWPGQKASVGEFPRE